VTLDNGSITYTPDANYHGPASFIYQVCDNGTTNGASDSQCATGTVNITVNSVNDNPVAVDDSASTDEDTPVTIDVVANDTDVDGDTRTLQSVGTASHGTVTIISGQAQYSPPQTSTAATALPTLFPMVMVVKQLALSTSQSIQSMTIQSLLTMQQRRMKTCRFLSMS
jgi:hypothetical protein